MSLPFAFIATLLSVIAIVANEGTARLVTIGVLVVLLVALAVGKAAGSYSPLAARANIVQITAGAVAIGLLVYGLVA